MARLVAAFASSHSVMLTATREDWIAGFRQSDRTMTLFDKKGAKRSYDEILAMAPADSAARVTPEKMAEAHARSEAAIATLKRHIDATALDALIVVGDDQHEIFHADMMPAIGLYYGETIRNAARPAAEADDWYRRAQDRRLEPGKDAHYPVHSALALHLLTGLGEDGFDLCAIRALPPAQYEGHAFSYVHRTYLAGRALPIVPILINTYYPPNPVSPARCVQLGEHLKALIASFPGHLRVGLMASGGLSHFVVDEALDERVIAALRAKDFRALARLDPKILQAGSSEIRSWIVTGAAAADLDLAWLDYIPAYRTPALTGTGLGFARWA